MPKLRDLDAYLNRLKTLEDESLPEKLHRFLDYLNQSSGQGVTQLLTQITNEVSLIQERVTDLNSTLSRVDFRQGQFLQLHAQPNSARRVQMVVGVLGASWARLGRLLIAVLRPFSAGCLSGKLSGMIKSLNVRQERFCEFVAAGESQTDAYLKAGFKVEKGVARRNAARLRTKADIQERISELRKPQTAAAIFTKEEKLAFLAAVVRTPIGQIGPDSPLCVDFVEETVENDKCGRLRRGDYESGNEQAGPTVFRRRVKMLDKLKALELHSKLIGDFAPDHHVVETSNKTLESIQERARRIASLMSIAPPDLVKNQQ